MFHHYNPNKILVRDTEFARFLRGHLRDKRIFTCQFVRNRKWSVCYWINGTYGDLRELAPLGKEPIGTRELTMRVALNLPGNAEGDRNREQYRNFLRESDRAWTRAELDEMEEERDADRFIHRRARTGGNATYITT